MIYVTGDLHGDERQIDVYLDKLSNLQSSDMLIIAGDFGLPWWTETINAKKQRDDMRLLKKLADAPFTVCFVDGNHENFDLLATYPTEAKWGGVVQNINGVYRLLRGELYTIEGHSIFTFGGATSTDKHYRKENISWWKEENASLQEKDKGVNALEKVNWTVDYVITHQAPKQFFPVFSTKMMNAKKMNCMTQDYLTKICSQLTYRRWYFGHYHGDMNSNELNMRCRLLYYDIVELGG